LDLRSYGPYSCCSSTPSSASGVGLTTVVGPVVTEMHRCGRSCGRRIFCAHCNTTILGHRAGPARHGPGTGQARPAGVGPARHAVPPVPCLTGPRAPLTAQARPLGLKFGPCRPHSPAKTCGPCQPTTQIVENHSSDS